MLTIDYNSYRTTTPTANACASWCCTTPRSTSPPRSGADHRRRQRPLPDPGAARPQLQGRRLRGPAHLQPGRRGRPRLARRRQRLGAPRQPQRHLHRHRDRQPRPRRRRRVHLPDYERSQINALKQLAKNILQRYPDMTPKNVVGHSDIAVGRKSDPVRSCLGRNSTRPVSAPGMTTPPAIAIAKASSATACRRAPTCWRRSACTAMRCRRRSTTPTSPACCAPSRCISARRTTTARWMWRRRRSSTL